MFLSGKGKGCAGDFWVEDSELTLIVPSGRTGSMLWGQGAERELRLELSYLKEMGLCGLMVPRWGAPPSCTDTYRFS